jgi:hypothetical protein
MDPYRSRWFIRATAGITTLVFAATLIGFGPASAPAQAADPLTALFIDGEDHSVGVGVDHIGKSFVIYGDDAESVKGLTRTYPESVSVIFDDPDAPPAAGNGRWSVNLASARGIELDAGTYAGAVRVMSREGSQPGIDVTGNAQGCNSLTGEFVVHEIAMDLDNVQSLAASFRQRCDPAGGAPPPGDIYGEVRFNSSIGFKAADMKPWAIDFGMADSATLAGTEDVTIRSLGIQTLNLGVARIVGADASSFGFVSDGCSNQALTAGGSCVMRVSATPSTNRILEADLEVPDDTFRGKRTVHLKVRGIGEVDGTAVISPQYYYPVKDGYKDRLTVEGTRNGEQTLNVKVRTAEGALVYEDSLPSASGDYQWTWNGHLDGEVMPAGSYDVIAKLGETSPNTKVVTKRIFVRHDYVTWAKKRVSRTGRQIWAWGRSRNALIGPTHGWPTGVRLNSGKGFAAVLYSFPVAKSPSNIYGWMSFQVLGKSPNKRKALIAIWNPKLGGALDLKNYDVAKKVGPQYRWWKTGVIGQKHKKNGKARAAVMVWKGLGGWGKSIFAVNRVRLIYKVGTLHKVTTTASGATALEQALRSRGPDGVAGTRVSRVPGSDALRPLSVAPPLDDPAEATDAAEPSPAPGEPGAEATAEPGSDESRESPGSRGRRPAPDPAPTNEPAE